MDALLDDPVFFTPFVPFFDARYGRPSIPMETYLRLMFLKFRYRLGYETLCREVTDSISRQRFARILLGTRVPHPTTLMKITTKCEDSAVAALNDALLVKAAAAKAVAREPGPRRYHRRRRLCRVSDRLGAAGQGGRTDRRDGVSGQGGRGRVPSRTRSRDRRRAAGRRAPAIAGKLKLRGAQQPDEAQATVQRITGELADLPQSAMREAAAVIRNGKRACRHATWTTQGQLRRALSDLETILDRAARVIAQTRSRLGGVMPESSTRLVSLHDPDARPIRKGRLGIPVEFGYKARLVDNQDGVILDHNVEIGNPPDAPQLALAIERITRRSGRTPRGNRRPRLRKPRSKTNCTSSASASSRSHARPNPARPAASSNTAEPPAKRSSRAPAARA